MLNVQAPRPGEVLAGKFRVERVLGAGGMGTVVEATDAMLGRRVALKIAHPQMLEDPSAVSRFVREARAMAALRGAGFVRVFEVGTLDLPTSMVKVPFLVMELLDGLDLKARLRMRGPMPLEEVTLFIAQACEAIAEAHAVGLVHRDIKPSNLFVEHRPDGTEMLRVLDFGISKPAELSETLTASSMTLGSPRYMSPEQTLDPHDVDARTDVWSLGVSLYELWTGKLPFDGGTHLRLCKAILENDPTPPSELRPMTPPVLEQAILRCLSKDRDQRFQDVGALAEALATLSPLAAASARAAQTLIRNAAAKSTGSSASGRQGDGSGPNNNKKKANDDGQQVSDFEVKGAITGSTIHNAVDGARSAGGPSPLQAGFEHTAPATVATPDGTHLSQTHSRVMMIGAMVLSVLAVSALAITIGWYKLQPAGADAVVDSQRTESSGALGKRDLAHSAEAMALIIDASSSAATAVTTASSDTASASASASTTATAKTLGAATASASSSRPLSTTTGRRAPGSPRRPTSNGDDDALSNSH